jgi:hypothetical protein
MKKQQTKGYKVTNSDLTCNGYQFELKKIHTQSGVLKICSNGFHFCSELNDCFNYYSFDPNNRVFEIIAYGDLDTNGDKSCSLEIKLQKELSWIEVLNIVNTGAGNNGRMNAGSRNAGSRNAGNDNAGYYNAGSRNAGYYNAGSRNAGYYNAGNDNAGAFNNLQANYMLFNKPSDWTYDNFINSTAFGYLQQVDTALWIPDYKMSEEEKKQYPYYITTGGYVRSIPYKEAFSNSWNNWNLQARQSFLDLPNFDKDIFKEITGIDV